MSEKKVSIVLPVYNGANHISDSIQSIINQTYQNWELIIVNDCSTDNTLQIVNEYADKDDRIKVFSNEKNLKLPKTLNAGFEKATGEYFTWTSDDNMYKPMAIKKLAMELDGDSTLSMVYSNYTNIDAEGNVIGEGMLQSAEFLVAGNVCGASFMYTAEAAKQIGMYDANLFLAEDYDYWIRMMKYGRIKHIEESLYLYRRHADSLTETKRALINMQTYKAIEKNFLFLYWKAKCQHLQYELFEHMLRRADCEHYKYVKEMLLSVDQGYKWLLLIKRMKNIISDFGWHKRR